MVLTGFELDSRLEATTDDITDLYQSDYPIRGEPAAQPARVTSQVSAARQNLYFVTPDYRGVASAGHVTADDDQVTHKPRPPGYVTVGDREILARGETPSRLSTLKETGVYVRR